MRVLRAGALAAGLVVAVSGCDGAVIGDLVGGRPGPGGGGSTTTTVTGDGGSTSTTASGPGGSDPTSTTASGPGAGDPTTTTESEGVTGPEHGDAVDIVWEENFDTLDTSRWALEHSTYGDGNGELQCYRPENVTVTDGKLVLRAVAETYTCPNGSTRQVTSGMVRSRGLTFSPGQALEFRVKLTPADSSDQGGLWPAVWSSSWATGGWPAGGELDFLEVMTATNPRRSIYSIHYAKPNGSHGVTNKPVVGTGNFSEAWHTVRFEYGENGILVWFLDGAEVFRVEGGVETIQGYPAPFDSTISEIKINLALGGSPGPLAPAAVAGAGATFEVDHIRVVTL